MKTREYTHHVASLYINPSGYGTYTCYDELLDTTILIHSDTYDDIVNADEDEDGIKAAYHTYCDIYRQYGGDLEDPKLTEEEYLTKYDITRYQIL